MMSINLKGTSEVRVEYRQKRFFIKNKNNVMFLKTLSKIMFEKRRQQLSSYYIPSSSKTSFALLIRIEMSKISILRLTLQSFSKSKNNKHSILFAKYLHFYWNLIVAS